MKNHQSTTNIQISKKFKTIVENYLLEGKHLRTCYKPSLAEVEYLGQRLLRGTRLKMIFLRKIILTSETASILAKYLNDSDVDQITIMIKSNAELELVSKLQNVYSYNCSGSKIRLDKMEYFAKSLNIERLAKLNLTGSNINNDGLKILIKTIKLKLKETKKVFDLKLMLNNVIDLNTTGLIELLNCAQSKYLEFYANVNGGHCFRINNKSHYNKSEVKLHFSFPRILESGIDLFLKKCQSEKLTITVYESNPQCNTLLFIINLIKDINIKSLRMNIYETNLKKIEEIMDRIIKTHVTDLDVNIDNLNSGDLEIINNKLEDSKIERFTFSFLDLVDSDSQTVVKFMDKLKLNSISFNYCRMSNKMIKQIIKKLDNSTIKEFTINQNTMKKKLVKFIANAITFSNLTTLNLSGCEILYKQVKILFDALKNTEIISIDLCNNKINNAGTAYISENIGNTKLSSILLDFNYFQGFTAVVKLLNAIRKTKITACGISDYCYRHKDYEAIFDAMKDNKILLNCVMKGSYGKIDEVLDKNRILFEKAQSVIEAYQNNTVVYNYEYKEYFKAFELFNDTDILWDNVNNRNSIKLTLNNNIKNNYLRIIPLVRNELEVDDKS